MEEFGGPMSPYPTFRESYPLASGLRHREAIALAIYLHLKQYRIYDYGDRYHFWIEKHKGSAPRSKGMEFLCPESHLAHYVREGLGLLPPVK
jgi:hypothetical protein